MNATEAIQILSQKAGVINLQKERLIKDVRYQEFNEMTLGCNESF